METRQKRPNVVLSRSGVLQVAPAEIFKSEVGRAEIRKTARLDAARQARERAREKAIVKK